MEMNRNLLYAILLAFVGILILGYSVSSGEGNAGIFLFIPVFYGSGLFAFIGQIQEETHRAAIGFHQKQRSKTSYGSALEQIPGIGESRRVLLLKTFKTIKGIREAELASLKEVLPEKAAQAVYDYFRSQKG